MSDSIPTDPRSGASRKRRIQALARAGELKVCVGCDRPVGIRALTCPSCHAYRFATDAASITRAVAHATRRKGWKDEILS